MGRNYLQVYLKALVEGFPIYHPEIAGELWSDPILRELQDRHYGKVISTGGLEISIYFASDHCIDHFRTTPDVVRARKQISDHVLESNLSFGQRHLQAFVCYHFYQNVRIPKGLRGEETFIFVSVPQGVMTVEIPAPHHEAIIAFSYAPSC
jgi:hypothetical protein